MAARFWVGGSGTWDASDTTHWSGTSGGAGGSSVPGSADTVTIDGHASGLNGGTITVNTNITIQSLNCAAMVGTLDFATNDNNITLSAVNSAFTISGSSTRVLNMGDGTWAFTGANCSWDATTVTGLTLNCNGSTIHFNNATASASRLFAGGGRTYNTVTLGAMNSLLVSITGSGNTIATLNVAAGSHVTFPGTFTITITNLNVVGTAALPILLATNAGGSVATVAVTTASIVGAALRWLTFTGSPTATDSVDLGGNSGITITPPASGGAVGVIGG